MHNNGFLRYVRASVFISPFSCFVVADGHILSYIPCLCYAEVLGSTPKPNMVLPTSALVGSKPAS